MYSFLVLGIVPGTNIQITFQAWLDACEVVFALLNIFFLIHLQHQARTKTVPVQTRQPLPANQLHFRVSY